MSQARTLTLQKKSTRDVSCERSLAKGVLCRCAGLKPPSDDLPGGFVVEDPAVVVGAGEFGGGFLVEAEDGGRVELEGGGGVHRGDWAFDGLSHGVRFVFSRCE